MRTDSSKEWWNRPLGKPGKGDKEEERLRAKPCPYCLSLNIWKRVEPSGRFFRLSCMSCGYQVEANLRENAFKKWNETSNAI